MANVTDYTKQVLAQLNASAIRKDTYPAISDDDGVPTDHAIVIINQSASAVIIWLAQAGNPEVTRWVATSAGIANNTLITPAVLAKLGPIVAVRVTYAAGGAPADNTYQAAEPVPPTRIRRYSDDAVTLNLTLKPYIYSFQGPGTRLYHPGNLAKLDYIPDTIAGNPTNVPPGYENAVLAQALAYLFPLEGSNVEAGQHYKGLAESMRSAVMSGQPLPDVSPVPQGG